MAASNPGGDRDERICGRGFASIDPERQREVVGYVRGGAIDTTPAQRFGAPRSSRFDWTRIQVERDSGNFEGSSSRRGR